MKSYKKIILKTKYFDNFSTNKMWTVEGNTDTACEDTLPAVFSVPEGVEQGERRFRRNGRGRTPLSFQAERIGEGLKEPDSQT